MKLKIILMTLLFPMLCNGQVVKSIEKLSDRVNVTLADGKLSVIPQTNNTIRIKYYSQRPENLPELIFTTGFAPAAFEVVDSPSKLEIRCTKITVSLDKQTGNLTYSDASGKIFLSEKPGTRKLTPSAVQETPCFIGEQSFETSPGEHIYGLGQFQDGFYDLRGVTRRLTQVNTQIAIPFIYSSRGYGLLWHQYGLTDFNPADNNITLVKQEQAASANQVAEVTTTSGTQRVSQNQSLYNGQFTIPQDGEYSLFLDLADMGNRHFVAIDGKPVIDQTNMWLPPTVGTLIQLAAGEHQVQVLCKSDNKPQLSWKMTDNATTFRSPTAMLVDYVVFAGSADEVIASYRKLSGNAPMFPKWAYGFWQCRERYASGKQLVETVEEFRKRQLPVDVIVQDWQYWGNNGWGVPKFDEKNYPNPKEFIGKLHDLNARFNISIWSNPDRNSEVGKEFVANNRFVANTKWLDYFNPETRKDYWSVLKTNMFDNGVDSWWMDAVEPENDALKGEKTFFGAGDFYRLTYPYFVSKSVYEGQRATSDQKRVCILTRSAYPGQQRYGIINWSGDIGGTWDAYKRQIVAGLNYSVTGFPYWTTDVGGFFRPGQSQYTDEKYHELMLRWFQWAVFNPVFRVHGYMSETEPWKYGQAVEDKMRETLNLRYTLLPYIYSEAWQITSNGSTLMRPLVMDFRSDTTALTYPYEYMFGKSLLVAPVTEAGAKEWTTYLPQAKAWYDFRTGEKLSGGKTVTKALDLNVIPVYVKAGSVLPVGPKMQYATEKKADKLEIRVYEGADGEFVLYEDENDNYNYEKGLYSTITFRWDDKAGKLTISDRKGSFPGMLKNRSFTVVKISSGKPRSKEINYTGKSVRINL